jgi:DNA-binding phage protein
VAGLTRSFKESVKARVEREPAFREALLAEAVDSLIAGEVEVGNAMLRDFINATMGFEKLSLDVGTPAKSLMRMLSPTGNPTASNLFAVIRQVQQSTGVHLEVAPSSAPGISSATQG